MSHTFTLPIRQPDASETVSFRVDWGDSTSEIFTFDGNTWSTQDFSHYYSNNNLKTIKIYPPNGEKFGKYWSFSHANATNSAAQMSHITKWGSFEFSSAGGSFKNCVSLDIDSNLTGTPAINYPNSLHSAFSGCTAFHPEPNQLINWDTSAAATLYETFHGCSNFNSSVSDWNVSNVTNTTRMFADCVVFNHTLTGWNNGSTSNTGNLVTATAMFRGASSFNQSLSDWNVSKLVWIEQMFKNATNFASNVFVNYNANGGSASLQETFMGTKFNAGQVTTWDVSNIMFFGSVFEDNAHFNQDIGDWDVGGAVGGFSNMFKGATSFNKDISEWDTSSTSNFSGMFQGASSFNQNINTKSAITKHGSTYNPWTIKTSSGPNNLNNMLHGAAAFDQDISDWNMTHISSADDLLEGTDLSAENAAAINDSGTGWPSQSGVDSDAVAASQAAQQASGTAPVITSHPAQGSTYTFTNPENTQTTVNVVATGSPVPTLSLANNSAAIDKDKFTLVDNGDGTGTLKLTNAPNFESPTDDGWAGQNTYAVYVHATNAVGSANAFFNFSVTDVADVPAPNVTGLHVDNTDLTTIQFGWNHVANAVNYKYQVSTTSDFSGIVASGTHNSNILNVTGLSPATPYYFRLKISGGGASSTYEVDSVSWTSISSVTAGADANFPSLSGNQFITNPENSQVVVALVSAGNPTPTLSLEGGYDSSKFTLVDNGDGTGTLKLTSAPNYESATDSSGDGYNTYRTYVKATNSLGSESLFYKFTVTDVADYPVPTITGLGLGTGFYYDPPGGTSIEFHFDLKSGVPSYQIQFASDANFNNIIYSTNDYVPNSGYGYYLASGLSPQTTYWIRVKGNPGAPGTYELPSVDWATFSATTAGIAPVITSHSNDTTTYQIANPENTQEIVNLTATGTPTPSWSLDTNLPTPSNNEDAGDFTLVDNGNGTATLKLTSSPDYEAPADGNNVSPNNTYYVRPIATNSVGNSTANFLFNVTDTSDVTAPQVTGLTTTYNSTLSGGPAMVWGWNDISNIAEYKFQIATDPGFSSVYVSRDDVTSSGFYIANASALSVVAAFLPSGNGATFNAQPGTTYWVRAKALGGGPGAVWEADGNWSTAVSVVADEDIDFVDNISQVTGGYYHHKFLKGGRDYINYVNIHGDLLSHYNGGYDWAWYGPGGSSPGTAPSNSRGKYAFGKSHYELAGESEGRTINNMGGETGSAWGVGKAAQAATGDDRHTSINSNSTTEFPRNSLNNVYEIVGGEYHNYFFTNDKSIYANGENYSYELLTGPNQRQGGANTGAYSPNYKNPIPFLVASPDSGEYAFDKIAGGNGHTLFLKNGVVYGIGGNDDGELGEGGDVALFHGTGAPGSASPQLLDLTDSSNGFTNSGIVDIFAGGANSFFLKEDGSLWATGNNSYGSLGCGNTWSQVGAEEIFTGDSLATRVAQVSSSGAHTLFIMDNGDLYAAGKNLYGQLGLGTTTNWDDPKFVAHNVIMASAGLNHSNFLDSSGQLWAVGDNQYGQLGDGTDTDRSSAVCINAGGAEPQDVVGMHAGSRNSMFLKSDGSVWITGWASYGLNSQGVESAPSDNNLYPERAQWS